MAAKNVTQLSDILLGSNRYATTGYTAATGSVYDITLDDYGRGSWSVSCNIDRIDAGTIGWVIRSDGNWGHVAGVLAVERPPRDVREANGVVTYARGIVFPFPREWWIDGARLNLAGWPRRAPFGRSDKGRRMAQFQGGESLPKGAVALIEKRLHPVVADWVADHRGSVVS